MFFLGPTNRAQTYDTLRFAEQAKKVETSAIKNKKLRREEMQRIIDELRQEKAQLERTLREKSLEQANGNSFFCFERSFIFQMKIFCYFFRLFLQD